MAAPLGKASTWVGKPATNSLTAVSAEGAGVPDTEAEAAAEADESVAEGAGAEVEAVVGGTSWPAGLEHAPKNKAAETVAAATSCLRREGSARSGVGFMTVFLSCRCRCGDILTSLPMLSEGVPARVAQLTRRWSQRKPESLD